MGWGGGRWGNEQIRVWGLESLLRREHGHELLASCGNSKWHRTCSLLENSFLLRNPLVVVIVVFSDTAIVFHSVLGGHLAKTMYYVGKAQQQDLGSAYT